MKKKKKKKKKREEGNMLLTKAKAPTQRFQSFLKDYSVVQVSISIFSFLG